MLVRSDINFSTSIKCLSVALVNVANHHKEYGVHKDLNGGFGTADDFDGFLGSSFIRFFKKHTVSLPIISFAHLQSIFKQKDMRVSYIEENYCDENNFDIVLIYGSMVDHRHENQVCRLWKKKMPQARVGIFGNFAKVCPEFFDAADFIISGEAEHFFDQEFKSLDQLKGYVQVRGITNYDSLPVPDLSGFPIDSYQYSVSRTSKRFIPYQSSKGCPYSCSYYCTYGKFQGPKIRQRSAKNVVRDLIELKEKYNIERVQFRDPVFGLQKGFIEDLCETVKENNLDIIWGMETRADLLNEENLRLMRAAGLRRVNIGIETTNANIAKTNKRPLIKETHQENVVRWCKELGITVAAFYVFGLDGDTPESIEQTVDYAIKLNTPIARFAVATPYPGTDFYKKLKQEDRLLIDDLEKYTQFNLVFKHTHLSPQDIKKFLGKAYRRYYLRINYWIMMLRGYVRRLLFK